MIAAPSGSFVSMIFVFMVVLKAQLTVGYAYGAAASFVAVVYVNYVFTFSYRKFDFTISSYPLTFLTMLSVSLIVSALMSQNKRQEQLNWKNDARLDAEQKTALLRNVQDEAQ